MLLSKLLNYKWVMKMRKIIYLIFVSLFLMGCTSQPISKNDKLKLIVASDIHYFLKDYYQDCEWFEESMLYGDGKMVTYADEILDAFISDIKIEKPDLVILTGDLSFNGEKGSHQGLAKKLKDITDAGIAVAVIPGNHDVDNIFAKGYGKDDYMEVEKTNAEDFQSIYKNMGYNLAVERHQESLSYRIDLNDQYSLLMMDSTAHKLTGQELDIGGFFTESTMKWLNKQLESIKSANKTPLIALHHNLTDHNPLLNKNYTIKDHEKIADLLESYQVPFVLSGHIHCQNIKKINNIYDIASSSLLDAPLQYGIIELDHEKMDYHTQPLYISQNSDEYFDEVSKNRFLERIDSMTDQNNKESVLDVIALANRYYFAGTISEHKDEIMKMPGYAIINKEDKLEFCQEYLTSMLSEETNSQKLSIKFS